MPNSMKGLPAAIEAAKKVALDDNATDQDVKEAIEKLQEELNKLVPRPDKSELQELIETAKGKEGDKYTEDSYTNLQKELEKAKLVNDDDNADADQVGESIESLKDALEKLQEKPEEIRTSIPADYPTAQPLPEFPIDEVPSDTASTSTVATTATTTLSTTIKEAEPTNDTTVFKDENTTSATTSSETKVEVTTSARATTIPRTEGTTVINKEQQITSLIASTTSYNTNATKLRDTKKNHIPKTGETEMMGGSVLLVIMLAVVTMRIKLRREEIN